MLPIEREGRDGYADLYDLLTVYSQFWSTIADPGEALADLGRRHADDLQARMDELDTQDVIAAARELETALGRWATPFNLISKGTQQLLLQTEASHTQREDLPERVDEAYWNRLSPENLSSPNERKAGRIVFDNEPLSCGQEKVGIPESWVFDKALDTLARWFNYPETMATKTWYPAEGAAGWESCGPTGLTARGDSEKALETLIYRQQLDAFFHSICTPSGVDEALYADQPQFPAYGALAGKLKAQARGESQYFVRSFTDADKFTLDDISMVKPELTVSLSGWMPILETWEDFKTEAMQAFETALSRYQQEVSGLFDACGFSRAPERRSVGDHFEWFIHYQVHGASYEVIGERFHFSSKAIRNGVMGVSELIGLPQRAGKRGPKPSSK